MLLGHDESCSNLMKIDNLKFISASFDRTIRLWSVNKY